MERDKPVAKQAPATNLSIKTIKRVILGNELIEMADMGKLLDEELVELDPATSEKGCCFWTNARQLVSHFPWN